VNEQIRPFGVVGKSGKFVRQEILEQYAIKSKVIDDGFTKFYGPANLIEPSYDPYMLASLIEQNVYHARAVQTKAGDIVGNGWEILPLSQNALDINKQTIIDMINGFTVDLMTTLKNEEIDYHSIGYGALEISHKEDGTPDLRHIPSIYFRIGLSKTKAMQVIANLRVFFKRYGLEDIEINSETGEQLVELIEDKIATSFMYWSKYSPRDNYYGMADIIPAMGAITGSVALRDYNIAFFDNYGVPSYAVYITGHYNPGPVGEDGLTDIERIIEAKFQEIQANPHAPMILGIPSGGRDSNVEIKFERLSVEQKEASFRLYRVDNRDEILAAHGVPPYRLGIAEVGALGGTTARESTEIYKRSIVEPRQSELEAFMNLLIRTELGIEDWEFKFKSIDIEDETAELEKDIKIFAMAGLTPNEVRKRNGLPEIDLPEMNYHYLNGQAIELLSQQAQASTDPFGLSDTQKQVDNSIADMVLQELNTVKKAVDEEMKEVKKSRWFNWKKQ
jgi:PBSX family phage portal protein